jgi:hypothetical protein
MNFRGFTLEPSHQRHSIAKPDEQRTIGGILERERLIEGLPAHKTLRIELHNNIPFGTPISQAHAMWTESYFPKVETPAGFPRQPNTALCPEGLVKLVVECINKGTGGMSSHYGFEGYYLSVLVSLDKARIWDVRGEPAS